MLGASTSVKEVDLSKISRLTDTQRRVKELRKRASDALSAQRQAKACVECLPHGPGVPTEARGVAQEPMSTKSLEGDDASPSNSNSIHSRLLSLAAKVSEAESERRTAQLRGEVVGSKTPTAGNVHPEKRKRFEGELGGPPASSRPVVSPPPGSLAVAQVPLVAATAPQARTPPRKTMFGTASMLSSAPVARTQVDLVDITERPNELLDLVRKELLDDSRIQAPTIGVAVSLELAHNSFAQSSAKGGKVHFGLIHNVVSQVRSVVLHWDGCTYISHREAGLQLVSQLLGELAGVELITFNAPALLIPVVVFSEGVVQSRCVNDIRTMAWMLTPSDPCASYDSLLGAYLPHSRVGSSESSLEGAVDRLAHLVPLYRKLYGLLGSASLLQPFMRVEKHICLILCKMKVSGFLVDINVLTDQQRAAEEEMSLLRSAAADFCSDEAFKAQFNIQSPDDCRALLFSQLGLDRFIAGESTTKTGKLSTSEETLKLLIPHHPLPSMIISYRKLAKLSQTYVDGILEHAIDKRGLVEGGTTGPHSRGELREVHCNFLQESTDTGRLSCTEPNMQNLPRSTSEAMGGVRRAFVAPEGCAFVAVDYEQIELCVLAHCCEDPVMTRTLRSNDKPANDIHRAVASLVYKVDISAVSPEQRLTAKRVVFGVLYGIGPKALASQIGQSQERAAQIQQQFNAAFPLVERLRSSVLAGARRDGCVRTLMGRWRPVHEISNANPQVKANAERQAFNTVIQGSAADIVKRAMIEVLAILPKHRDVHLVGQVHDELIFIVPHQQQLSFIPEVRRVMTSATTLSVPLRVKVMSGATLGTLEEVN